MNAPCIRLQAATPSDLADWLDVLQQTRAAALARHGLTEGRCPPPPTPIAPSPPPFALPSPPPRARAGVAIASRIARGSLVPAT